MSQFTDIIAIFHFPLMWRFILAFSIIPYLPPGAIVYQKLRSLALNCYRGRKKKPNKTISDMLSTFEHAQFNLLIISTCIIYHVQTGVCSRDDAQPSRDKKCLFVLSLCVTRVQQWKKNPPLIGACAACNCSPSCYITYITLNSVDVCCRRQKLLFNNLMSVWFMTGAICLINK